MHLLLYIQIKPTQKIRFGNPFSKLSGHDVVQCYDTDNHSDEWMISQLRKAIIEANKITLVLDAVPSESLGKLTQLLEALLRKKQQPLTVLLHGKHDMLSNMLRLSKTEVIQCKEWVQLEAQVAALMKIS